ncbi:MAG: hypothetical protein EB075_07120 [Bacteroidetes bacterium]|nr:hypothetical protein [Bacteroidota bacterium]
MLEVKPFRLGVVEGFFGKSWSWEARRHYAQFLSGNGFTTYLYAPKNDDYFRKHWTQLTLLRYLKRLKLLFRCGGDESTHRGVHPLYRHCHTVAHPWYLCELSRVTHSGS